MPEQIYDPTHPNLERATANELGAILRLQVAVDEARKAGRTWTADCLRGALRQLTARIGAQSASRGALEGVAIFHT